MQALCDGVLLRLRCVKRDWAGQGAGPTAGVEVNCLVLKGPDNVVYDISAAKPRPRLGYRAVQLSGTKSHKLGICQQGPILENIQWSYTTTKCD